MTSAIDSTVKGVAANSYATLEEANSYFIDRLHTDLWDASSNDNRTKALLMACRVLDSRVEWIGDKTSEGQALQWPRIGVPNKKGYQLTRVYLNENTIPKWLKEAQYEQAIVLLGEDTTSEPDTAGITRLKVDTLEFTFDKRDRTSTLPRPVRELINDYGFTDGSKPGTVKLVRA